MPLFDYVGPNGEVREILDPVGPPQIVDERGVVWSRSSVQAFSLTGFRHAETQGEAILRGYHEQECIRGSRFHTIHHPETIKRAWKDDRMPAMGTA